MWCIVKFNCFPKAKLKKLVSDADVDLSAYSYSNESKCDSGDSSPTSFSNPAPCLDRLTEKIPVTKLSEAPCDTTNKCGGQEDDKGMDVELPVTSIDKIVSQSSTELEEKAETIDIFHDAAETINESDSQLANPPTDITHIQTTTDTDPAGLNEDKFEDKLSPVLNVDEEDETLGTDLPVEADDLEHSFKEKANEEIMEKDLPETNDVNKCNVTE